MTLHQTVDISRKILLYVGVGLGVSFVLYLIIQLGIITKNIIAPPPVQPPTTTYGKIQPILFPPNRTDQKLSYTLNTITGELPVLPDRIAIFKLNNPEPNFLNLSKTKEKVGLLHFVDTEGALLPERKIDDATYQWQENTGLRRKITFDIVSFNFDMESNFLTRKPDQELPLSEADAIAKVSALLNTLQLTPEDLDPTKINNSEDNAAITKPQLFAITNGALVPASTVKDAQVIRVDLYQKDAIYKLDTGQPAATGGTKHEEISVPIVYPQPPYSTMNFWVGTGTSDTEVVAANFFYQKPLIDDSEKQATYPIKSAEEAFTELKDGKGYIAAYFGTETAITISNVYLAYYLGDKTEQYLMPVIVFEGNNGFFAYVSALQNDWQTTEEK